MLCFLQNNFVYWQRVLLSWNYIKQNNQNIEKFLFINNRKNKMKKLFILIAFLMLSGAVMAEPQMKDLQALTATKPYVQPPMFSNHNSILENLFLNQKGDRFLADGEEVYTNGIATGQ